MASAELPRKLRTLDAAAIVVGTVVGSAIFLVPGNVAASLTSAPLILLVWAFTGALSFFGALAYAELGAMKPDTGGQYVYLRESFGSMWAFLCGWAFLLVIQSGSAATLSAGFSIYLSYFIPLSPSMAKIVSISLIAVLTVINYRGVEGGAAVQNLFTFLKIGGIAVLLASAFFVGRGTPIQWTLPDQISFGQFGVAMIACLWAYEGWNVVSFVAGEIKNPQRTLPRALGLGVGLIIVIYMLANLAYLHILPIDELKRTDRVAAVVMERSVGTAGASLVALTILLSIIGSTNGTLMTAPRVYFAMSRDALFFRSLGSVHPRFLTPHMAVLVQGVWTALLALSGSYDTLFSYVVFAAWIFYGMTVLGVIVLRRTHPDAARPYRMWGYPVTPLLFSAVAFGFVINTLVSTPGPSLIGLGLIATGIPVFLVWKKKAIAAAPAVVREETS